jgi:hypothetical protein
MARAESSASEERELTCDLARKSGPAVRLHDRQTDVDLGPA